MEIVKSSRSLNVLVTLILNTLIKGSGSSVVHSLNTPRPPCFFTTIGAGGEGEGCIVVTLLLSPLEIVKSENLTQFARQD